MVLFVFPRLMKRSTYAAVDYSLPVFDWPVFRKHGLSDTLKPREIMLALFISGAEELVFLHSDSQFTEMTELKYFKSFGF